MAMQRIGFIIPEGFQMLALAPQTVFEYANMCAGKAIYDVRVLSEKGRLLRSTLGIALQTERFSGLRFDTLIFGGTNEATPRLTPGLLNFARRALKTSRRVASMCTGAFVLAEAGLLDGRRATTHWVFSRELQRRFPKAKVEEARFFIVDGPVWTSAASFGSMMLQPPTSTPLPLATRLCNPPEKAQCV